MSWIGKPIGWWITLPVWIALLLSCGREIPIEKQVDELLQKRAYEQALDLLGEKLKREPKAWPLQDLRVGVLVAAGRPDEALSSYAERYRQGGPDSPRIFRRIAVALLEDAISNCDGLLPIRAAAALSTFASADLLPLLGRALLHRDASVRALAARGLGVLSGEEAGSLLRTSLKDPHPEVRAAATTVLAGRQDEETRLSAERALEDSSGLVRLRAADRKSVV